MARTACTWPSASPSLLAGKVRRAARHHRRPRPRGRRGPIMDLQPTRPSGRGSAPSRPPAPDHRPRCPREPARLRRLPAPPIRGRHTAHPYSASASWRPTTSVSGLRSPRPSPSSERLHVEVVVVPVADHHPGERGQVGRGVERPLLPLVVADPFARAAASYPAGGGVEPTGGGPRGGRHRTCALPALRRPPRAGVGGAGAPVRRAHGRDVGGDGTLR
jgi:hypothetical protein